MTTCEQGRRADFGCQNYDNVFTYVRYKSICFANITTFTNLTTQGFNFLWPYQIVETTLEQVLSSHQSCYKLFTACSTLVSTTWNKQCGYNMSTACEQTCYNVFAGLQQLLRFYVRYLCVYKLISPRTVSSEYAVPYHKYVV